MYFQASSTYLPVQVPSVRARKRATAIGNMQPREK
jgi:hypothetical protein